MDFWVDSYGIFGDFYGDLKGCVFVSYPHLAQFHSNVSSWRIFEREGALFYDISTRIDA